MKTKLSLKRGSAAAYALLIVMFIVAASVMILAGTLKRTYTVSKLNDRSNQLLVSQNAAEAAIEKIYARMQYDFQMSGGPAQVAGQLNNYKVDYPKSSEDSFWGNFAFTDPQTGNTGTYVT